MSLGRHKAETLAWRSLYGLLISPSERQLLTASMGILEELIHLSKQTKRYWLKLSYHRLWVQCSLHLSGTIILLRSLRVGKLQRSVGKDEKRFPKARDDA